MLQVARRTHTPVHEERRVAPRMGPTSSRVAASGSDEPARSDGGSDSLLPSTAMPDDNGNVLASIDPRAATRIHLVGVAGTGMGTFAGMLKAKGYVVTGSDEK